ncbi:glycosyltransferase family 2 protein [Lacticaseibacillus casei]|jgi:glycosyltransferase involved in cell wall biosynthesis|uniref:Glycosyltransferase family 2 protein n=1 Tax=Lacticaseibacillus huelsenbergensis TaxID=3035291 RepID=A0ABY8DTX6_9LACO|nr:MULTISPECIES: glycosyltransferase family 2 protein [Lacticaseibacillus]MDG3060852.1 glycosyltransferase family 2 protein [Lacticaseibacillus sp. BCRC 81376]QVI37360.1 glycosyltransferase family 2 protein [Lacticaseibacillus casei]QXG59150.1 glycosyltransferase family 2 protein [Lacticaseibacillus casei]WFB39397.1 glycosyltransferase family 2 protein [Lacticaseibacillus huelsenbergensis]WFB41100.1 glycosyltransferase family 2 protein [Lacticaseibacillus huelsenbergensis]
MALPVLWIVIPCYNEEKVLPITAPRFLAKLSEFIEAKKVAATSRILFVDDGSKDQTWPLIQNFAQTDPHYLGIQQSRNRGHQNAVLAGLMVAKDHADVTISIDADGQDDLNAMADMLAAYADGCEVVYGVRSNRKSDSWFKRVSAQAFYRFLRVMGVDVVYNHADYRLASSKVLQHLADFKEVNLFLRGMFPLVGFKSTSVYYERHERLAGKSHYPLSKMIALAINGVTSLSIKPIVFIAELGAVVSILGFIGTIWAVIMAIKGATVAGWASIVCIVSFLGGIQLLSLGVIGEYVGKTYLETKHRPRFIISDQTWHDEPSKQPKADKDVEKQRKP